REIARIAAPTQRTLPRSADCTAATASHAASARSASAGGHQAEKAKAAASMQPAPTSAALHHPFIAHRITTTQRERTAPPAPPRPRAPQRRPAHLLVELQRHLIWLRTVAAGARCLDRLVVLRHHT